MDGYAILPNPTSKRNEWFTTTKLNIQSDFLSLTDDFSYMNSFISSILQIIGNDKTESRSL